MGSLENRLGRLEATKKGPATGLTKEALRHLSDEDLDALEDAVEETLKAGVPDGEATFEDLYRVSQERGRRALDALLDAMEAAKRGEEPRASPERPDHVALLERAQTGDEEAQGELRKRNGYRIWKYRN